MADPTRPPQDPRVVPFPGQEQFTAQTTLTNEATIKLARAMLDMERHAKSNVDVLREAGKTWEEVSKTVGKSVRDVKNLSHEFNMSFQDMLKMPIPQLAKNFEGLTSSLLKIATPLASIQTVIQGFLAVDRIFTDLNKSIAIFQVSAGQARGGAFQVTPTQQIEMAQSRRRMTGMGLKTEDIASVFGAMSQTLPREISRTSGPAWAEVAGAVSKTLNISIERASMLVGESVRYGIQPEKLNRAVEGLKDGFKKLPTGEAADGLMELWRTSRLFGGELEGSIKTLGHFERELSLGAITAKDVSQIQRGITAAPFAELAKFVAVATQRGEKIEGKDIFEKIGNLQNMSLSDPGKLEAMYKRVTGGLLRDPSSSALANRTRTGLAMEILPLSAIGENLRRTERFELPNAPDMAKSAEEIRTTFQDQIQAAKDINREVSSIPEKIGQGMRIFKEAVGEAGAIFKKTMEDQANASPLAPAGTPNRFSTFAAEVNLLTQEH